MEQLQGKKKKGGGKGGGNGDNISIPREMFEQMMQMMMHMGGGIESHGDASPGVTSSDAQWKNDLNTALQKNSVSERPVYTAAERSKGKWVGTVSIGAEIFNSEAPAPSKKAAEQAAAKLALQALYPGQFQKSSPSGTMDKTQTAGKRKRGFEEEDDPKRKLLACVQLLVFKKQQRNIAKDDVTWAVEEFAGEKKTFQGSCTIVAHDPGTTFTGEVCDSKKKAEASAAQIAYDNMRNVFETLETEHIAKKKQKIKEEVNKMKEKHAERKAEKEKMKPESETVSV